MYNLILLTFALFEEILRIYSREELFVFFVSNIIIFYDKNEIIPSLYNEEHKLVLISS